jgi:hypothetical protein
VAENGQRNLYGTRHNHCYTSPVYREKAAAINRRLAERYGKHPAVVAWHISNEYSGRCYCPLCEQKFREYLRKKFDNDINKLNHAYWSTFWSHNYTSFDQIEFPSSRGETVIHGLNVDFRRYVSDMTIDFMSEEIKALRETAGDHILKIIIETGVLTQEEKIQLCKCVTEGGADYIKTCTGFGVGKATLEDIALFKEHIGPNVKMKASTGIMSTEEGEAFIKLGASRLGSKLLVNICKEQGLK